MADSAPSSPPPTLVVGFEEVVVNIKVQRFPNIARISARDFARLVQEALR
jgi:hypothetical protein